MNSWRTWAHGLFGGMISAAATTLSGIVGMPQTFNLYSEAGLLNLVKLAIPSALVAAFLYLKQSPLPVLAVTTTTVKQETVQVNKDQ